MTEEYSSCRRKLFEKQFQRSFFFLDISSLNGGGSLWEGSRSRCYAHRWSNYIWQNYQERNSFNCGLWGWKGTHLFFLANIWFKLPWVGLLYRLIYVEKVHIFLFSRGFVYELSFLFLPFSHLFLAILLMAMCLSNAHDG